MCVVLECFIVINSQLNSCFAQTEFAQLMDCPVMIDVLYNELWISCLFYGVVILCFTQSMGGIFQIRQIKISTFSHHAVTI